MILTYHSVITCSSHSIKAKKKHESNHGFTKQIQHTISIGTMHHKLGLKFLKLPKAIPLRSSKLGIPQEIRRYSLIEILKLPTFVTPWLFNFPPRRCPSPGSRISRRFGGSRGPPSSLGTNQPATAGDPCGPMGKVSLEMGHGKL